MDIIEATVGGIGKWQILVFVAIAFVKFLTGWHDLAGIFFTNDVNFTCADATLAKCDPNCTKWVYDRSQFQETIVTEFNLVCDRDHLAPIQMATYMAGNLVGGIVFSILSDRYGRHKIMMFSYFLCAIFGIAMAFVPNYWLFCLLRFLEGVAIVGFLLTSFVLVLEIVGIKYRDLFAILYYWSFNCAYITLPLVQYFVHGWREFCLVQSVPMLAFLPYYFFGPDSPRWLFTTGRIDEAVEVLSKAAKVNKKPSHDLDARIHAMSLGQNPNGEATGNFLDLFRTPNMRRNTLCLWSCWLTAGTCFYGISMYVACLGDDVFVLVAISGALCFPATILVYVLCRFWSRKKTLMLSFMLMSLTLVVLVFLDPKSDTGITCVMFALFGSCLSYPVVHLYTGELVPTVIRGIGMGAGSTIGVAGSMLSPFIAYTRNLSRFLPPLIFMILPVVSFVLLMFLPETLDTTLPETIEDAEKLG